jgi:murein DD-endopeptidase MepM/ murein hydrolase activator NlpD
MVTPKGLAVVGFHRDDTSTLVILSKHLDGNVRRLQLKPKIRVYREQRIDGLPRKMVTPPTEVLERIARDRQLVISARAHASKISSFSGKFSWPIKGIITGIYGSKRILNGKPRAPHYGIDIAAPEGTPVSAPQAGIIRMVSDLYFTGWTIILDHGHGVSSTFLHLKNAAVKLGDKVRKGEIIGTVGSTGRSTGAHLDWRINLFNKRLDPELVAGPISRK